VAEIIGLRRPLKHPERWCFVKSWRHVGGDAFDQKLSERYDELPATKRRR
jgi:hypothetical protein